MKKKRIVLLTMLIGASLLLNGCRKFDHFYDDTPPGPPRNIRTVTGDNRVDLSWDRNYEHDVAGYNIYYSYSYDGKYNLIGSSDDNYFIDRGANNGNTYYYAVTAYDYEGNESDLSNDVVYDTPRPEGFNQAIFDYNVSASNSGYYFKKYLVVPYNDKDADIYFEKYNNVYYLNVWEDEDIQDMGSTKDIWDISTAPISGWVPKDTGDNFKYVEAKVGHTYVIWTWDNHFAKVRITSISNGRLVFDWAYQLVEGNRELKQVVSDTRKFTPGESKRSR
jgi:hypothetical protein